MAFGPGLSLFSLFDWRMGREILGIYDGDD